jgi:DNA modification methylase
VKLDGVIYCGDNLEWMRQFPDEFVDLCYIDPPFFSNRYYEVIFNDGQEIRAFEDRWKGGIEHYIEWMRQRVFEIHRMLRPTGSFYLHCDYHAGHHLKVMCDDIFGPNQFQNEVVWHYRGAGVSPRRYGRRHDVIFFYAKGDEWTFNVDDIREPYAEATIERFRHYIGNVRGQQDYGVQKLHPKGKHPDDVWQIQPIAPSARERLGYPTQKPEALLERVIKASSNAGDLVFDAFCGCGTTLVMAERLKRRWLGIDVSPTACNLMKRRLANEGVAVLDIVGIPYEPHELKRLKPFEFQNWVVGVMGGTGSDTRSADMGIDGHSFMERDPIQVKQSESVGRSVVDNFETAVTRTRKTKGYIVAFSFTRGAYDEVARAKRAHGLDIELLTVKELVEEYGK